MYDPQSTSSGSIMPAYQWLVRDELDRSNITGKLEAMVALGVPYSEEDIANANENMDAQALKIEQNLYFDPDFASNYEADKASAKANGERFVNMRDREIVALIAYLQRLGTDIKIKETNEVISQNQ
jgi:cytochrome c oxidase cbb3-type subunit I/II